MLLGPKTPAEQLAHRSRGYRHKGTHCTTRTAHKRRSRHAARARAALTRHGRGHLVGGSWTPEQQRRARSPMKRKHPADIRPATTPFKCRCGSPADKFSVPGSGKAATNCARSNQTRFMLVWKEPTLSTNDVPCALLIRPKEIMGVDGSLPKRVQEHALR